MKSACESQRMRATIIVLLTIVVYLPALRGGFLWDDNYLITENRLIKASDGLYRYWFTTEADDYWPLTSTAWWVEWRLWGANPLGYHIVNILLHAANAVLVWTILQRLKILGAWVAALVFAVHPVNVATAAWISEQKNTQSMFFFALAILLYLRFDEVGQWKWYGFSLAAFLLALLSKAAVVMLPVVLLGCVWWVRGQLRSKDFLRVVPFFIVAAGLGLVTVWFQHKHRLALEQAVAPVGLASRLATAGSVPWFYLRQAVLPVHLALVYPHRQVHDTRWTSYALGVFLMGGLILLWRKRNAWGRPLLFGLGYFLTMLLPVLGFFDQSYHRISSVADHWQYYAIIGPIALAVVGLGKLNRYPRVALGVAGLLVLGVASWTRVCVYANAETFWREYATEDPDGYIAHVNLGVVLAQSGELEEAIGQFEQTIRLKPDYAQAYYDLGGALAQSGRIQEAIKQFEQAVRLKPNDAEVHNNLANALAQADQFAEAVRHYEEALRLRPDSAEMRANLRLAQQELARRQAPGSLNEK
jgi:hypothetical protein